jgi:hypothetical protein
MRTLFLLLLLSNLFFLFWQVSLMPFLPWQPEHFRLKSEPVPPLASHLPQLVLLNENYSTSNSLEKTVTNFANISTTEETNGGASINTSQNSDKKEQKPVVVPSTLQQIAGLNTTSSSNSKHEVLNSKGESALAQQITPNLPKQSKYVNNKMVCFEAGPYRSAKTPQNMANWLLNHVKNIYAEAKTRKTQELQATWVYLPFESRQAAQRALQRFNELGVRKDYGLVKSGAFKNAISLGLYRQPVYVKQRIKELRAKGYQNVKTQKRYRSDTKYWLNVKILKDAQNQLKETFRKKFSKTVLASVACESFN